MEPDMFHSKMQKSLQQMTREERFKQYKNECWSRRCPADQLLQLHMDVCHKRSAEAMRTIKGDIDVSYGDSSDQRMDVFYSDTTPNDAPIFVFIHGGYWQNVTKEQHRYQALPVVRAGAVHVAVEYILAPAVNLDTIVEQVNTATAHILKLARQRGSRGVYLTGHSAGGHLVAMVLSSDWSAEDLNLIKGAVLQSGLFDLLPLVDHPEVGIPMKMTKSLLIDGGLRCRYSEIEGRDHFDLVEELMYPDYELTQMQLALMGLKQM